MAECRSMDIIAQLEQSITTREIPPVPAVNFHITDDNIGEGGPKQKFARNIAAIETLFKLESENRNATTEEQEILSNYVGWGGLADAFDPDKGNWAKEYQTLKNLLSEDEYAAARASTLNAHYTSLRSFAPSTMRSDRWALKQEIFWSLLWVSATSLVCSLLKCRAAVCMVWNWIPSPAELLRSSIPTQKSK